MGEQTETQGDRDVVEEVVEVITELGGVLKMPGQWAVEDVKEMSEREGERGVEWGFKVENRQGVKGEAGVVNEVARIQERFVF